MKNAFIITVLSVLAGPILAQTGTPLGTKSEKVGNKDLSPEEHARKEAERMATTLTLTPDQKNKWEGAARERSTANQPLKEQMKGSTTPDQRRDLHRQMQTNNDAFDNKVAAILNPDQKQKYEQEKKTRRSKMKERGAGRKMKDE